MWLVNALTVSGAAFLPLFGEPIAAHIRNNRDQTSSKEQR